ncbi:hypothetical protein [Lacrimispora sp.]|nr:hypothetical protein [Lacrimispora sp.]
MVEELPVVFYIAGGSYEEIEKAKKIGRLFFGGVAVGLIAGDIIKD